MLSYCLKRRENTESKNPKVVIVKVVIVKNQNLSKSKKLADY